jgi:DNA-binding transcriptional MerR regulator
MFLRKEVEKMIGMPALRIKFYTEQGLCPGVTVKTGRGNERRYSHDDVVRLALVKAISEEAGISLTMIKDIFDGLHKDEVNNRGRSLTYDYLSSSKNLEYFVIDKTIAKLKSDKYVPIGSGYSFPSVSDESELLSQISLRRNQVVVMIFNLGLIFDQIDWGK